MFSQYIAIKQGKGQAYNKANPSFNDVAILQVARDNARFFVAVRKKVSE